MDSPLDDQSPLPEGELISQLITSPNDGNVYGDIYAGWLINHMDAAGAHLARQLARGRVTTVAVGSMVFLKPVPTGNSISFYAQCQEIKRSSMRIYVEVWLREDDQAISKVTEGEFVFVAIDDHGRTRSIDK